MEFWILDTEASRKCSLVTTHYVTWHDVIPNISSVHFAYKGNTTIVTMKEERMRGTICSYHTSVGRRDWNDIFPAIMWGHADK